VLVSFISNWITLDRGDIILTGTPEGVGYFRDPKLTMKDGDLVEVEIEGIGVLRNEVRAERRAP
jgi:2-keto-4-pentenoate hydratase/2-oxohepta-3-ene-1,7-dioic acid hydratase in catechol pathway